MEGFTSSLHVKGATAKRLQQAVTDLLSSEGFQVLDADTANPDSLDQGITRGVWIAKSKGDWATVFCSDFLFQQEIGRELSKQLKTHVLNIWTNEGSSWHYSLFHQGEEIDQFDSTGETGDELQEFLDNDMDELAEEFDDEDGPQAIGADDDDEMAGPVQEGLSKIAELQEQISSKMPDDVRAIYERLHEGKATLGEMRRFDQWSQANQAELSRFQEQLQAQTAELTAAMQGVFQNGFQADDEDGVPSMLQGVLPPDMAELFSKVLAGQATGEELQRFAELSQSDGENDLLSADDDVEEAFFGEGDTEDDEPSDEFSDEDEDEEIGDGPMLSEAALQQHLGALQPLLGKSVDPAAVAETLATQDETPEQPLGEFLSFLGIDAGYSELDFDCLEDLSHEELAEQGINLSPLLLVRSE
ncbi:hypothetical protein ETAA8_52130 [Anatilimnocola aggregata]|uniref:Uncharacterized protein n=1 Tax=Anatilimnocola aggregata TaxID=2528021 RepID=A0A517YIQ2_9BACT|nr:hypothetical protein [Anatilimnocola aggregata]QDU30094.1 hypothetical protein ETAA8_52130 [Anatilimnocola aggregata]